MSRTLHPFNVSSRVQIPPLSSLEEVVEDIMSFFSVLDDIYQDLEGKFYCKRSIYRAVLLCIDPENRRIDCIDCPVWEGASNGHG